MSRSAIVETIRNLQVSVSLVPAPVGPILLSCLSLIEIGVRLYLGRTGHSRRSKMLKDLFESSLLMIEAYQRSFRQGSVHDDALELMVSNLEVIVCDMQDLMERMENQSCVSRILGGYTHIQDCQDLRDRVSAAKFDLNMIAIARILDLVEQLQSRPPKRSDESAGSSSTIPSDVLPFADNFTDSWIQQGQDDTVSAEEIEAIVNSMLEVCDDRSELVYLLSIKQNQSEIDRGPEEELLKAIISKLLDASHEEARLYRQIRKS